MGKRGAAKVKRANKIRDDKIQTIVVKEKREEEKKRVEKKKANSGGGWTLTSIFAEISRERNSYTASEVQLGQELFLLIDDGDNDLRELITRRMKPDVEYIERYYTGIRFGKSSPISCRHTCNGNDIQCDCTFVGIGYRDDPMNGRFDGYELGPRVITLYYHGNKVRISLACITAQRLQILDDTSFYPNVFAYPRK